MTVHHRLEANLSGSTTADQIFDEELTDFDSVTPAWDGEVNELANFDATVDADGDITDNATGSHTGGNAIEFDFPDAVATYGTMNADAVNQTSGVISFWFDRNDFAAAVGSYTLLAGMVDGIAAYRWVLYVYNVSGVYKYRMGISTDAGGWDYGDYITVPDSHKVTLAWQPSTGAGDNNGWMHLYISDVLEDSITGVDNDTRDWDVANVGMCYTSSGTFGGSFLLDTIKIDPVGAPMLDTLAAQNGTYGISIPVMDTTARTVSFTDPDAETAVTIEFEIDPNLITMANGENFYIMYPESGIVYASLRYTTADGYFINITTVTDVDTQVSEWFGITDANHKVRVVWVAASEDGADDGYAKLYIDEVLKETLSDLDNDTKTIDNYIRFGACGGLDAGTYGIFYIDNCRWGPWVDLTSYVIGDITGHWGFMRDDPSVFIADSGVFEFTLNNAEEIFVPGLTDSLSGWDKGTPLMLLFQKDFITRRKIYGTVTNIPVPKEPFSNKIIKVTSADWFEYAATHPMISPAIETDQRGDEMLDTILTDIPIQPRNTDFSTGANVFDTAFDTVRFKSKAYSEISKVAVSELGPIYITKDPVYGETLVFESVSDRNGLIGLPEDTFDNNMTSIEVEYGDSVINRFTARANPRYIEAGVKVLFALGSPIRISVGEIITIRGNYTDPSGGASAVGANMIAPVITTDYLMNSQYDGGGVNRSADLTVNETYGAAGVVYELTNGSADVCWITKLQARGYLVYKYNIIEQAIEDADSQDEYGIFEKRLDQKYQKDPYLANSYGKLRIEKEKSPRLKVIRVNFIANKSDALMDAWLDLDIGDLVKIKETSKEIDGDFFIKGIKFKLSPTGIIHYSWVVEDMYDTLENEGLTPVNFDIGTTSVDEIEFGYIPQISSEPVNRTWSCWIETGAIDPINAGYTEPGMVLISASTSVPGGMAFSWFNQGAGAGDGRLYVVSHNWTVRAGGWQSDAGTILVNTTYHVAFSYGDIDNAASDPIIYINGAAVTTTEDSAPAGVYTGEDGSSLVLGNFIGFNIAFIGRMKDPRMYDVVLTPTEIAKLFTDGPHGDGITRGLVFRGPCVKTSELSYWEDHTIVAGDFVRDDMYKALGYPTGTIITRLI